MTSNLFMFFFFFTLIFSCFVSVVYLDDGIYIFSTFVLFLFSIFVFSQRLGEVKRSSTTIKSGATEKMWLPPAISMKTTHSVLGRGQRLLLGCGRARRRAAFLALVACEARQGTAASSYIRSQGLRVVVGARAVADPDSCQ